MEEQEKITQYLNNEMSVTERAAFEALLAKDKSYRDAVAIQREMQDFFKTRAPQLESQLTDLGKKHFIEKKAFWNAKKIAFGIGLLLLAVFFGKSFFLTEQTALPVEKKEKNVLPEKIESQDVPFDTIQQAPPKTAPTKPKLEKRKPSKSPKKSARDLGPIAALDPADFKENPLLEGLITEQLRGDGVEIDIAQPKLDAVFIFKKPFSFVLKGTTNVSPPYTVKIFSNKELDFNEDIKVSEIKFSGLNEEETAFFEFNVVHQIDLKKGLYYFLLEQTESEELLYVSKFQLK